MQADLNTTSLDDPSAFYGVTYQCVQTAFLILNNVTSYNYLSKNAPTLASCSFDKHGLILIIFGKQYQYIHAYISFLFSFFFLFVYLAYDFYINNNNNNSRLSLSLHFNYFIGF